MADSAPKFRKGDRVVHSRHGSGVCITDSNDVSFVVAVAFDSSPDRVNHILYTMGALEKFPSPTPAEEAPIKGAIKKPKP